MTTLTKFNIDLDYLNSPNDDAETAMIALINQLPQHWADRMMTFLPDDLRPGADVYVPHDPKFNELNPEITYDNFWEHWNTDDLNVNGEVLLSILIHAIRTWSDDQESYFITESKEN